ncbi:MAG: lysophospholipid acyltransferase family protein [Alistipes sp.]|nr:lysophospholipid acyltransferase family protein [Alistipes sp.]
MKSKAREIYENVMVALLWFLCYLVAILPRCVRYGVLRPFVSFVLNRVMHYRYDVIIRQLRDSFPEKEDAEIADICSRYYDHLAEMIVDTLSLAAMNNKKREKATEFNLTENFHEMIEGRNVVVLTSHYGFWEIALNLYLATPRHHLVVAYRPIKSAIVDKLMRRLRNNESVDVVPSQQLIRHYIANRNGINGKNIVIGLISDQNCPPTKGCCWHDFLRHDSLFFDGGELLAMKFGLPVYYLELERIEAGRYRHNYTLLYDGEEDVAPHEITERYVRCLERTIETKPEHWMWSHKRWKNRPKEDAKYYNNYKASE